MDDFNLDGSHKKLKALQKQWEIDVKSLPASEIFNFGTMEMYHGGTYPTHDSFCGYCWEILKNETPGERLIDWDLYEEDIQGIIDVLDYQKADKKHPDYLFLSRKLTSARCKKIAQLNENFEYTDIEIIALSFTVNGNRLEIPKDIFIYNYNELKVIMKNFEGKYSKNGFDFPYPAEKVLERIRNKETTNLKKTFQYFGTPKDLCSELCEMTFDPYRNKPVKILEPSAGQGGIIDAGHKDKIFATDWYAGMLMGITDKPIFMFQAELVDTTGFCTFFENGLCKLHDSGLKPTEGKLSHHSTRMDNFKANKSLSWMIAKEWIDPKNSDVIERIREKLKVT